MENARMPLPTVAAKSGMRAAMTWVTFQLACLLLLYPSF